MPSPRKRIGELLIAAGVIDPLDLQAALAHQRQWGGQLGATLIDRGFISEKTLVETLSQQLGLPIVKLSETPVDPRALPLVPARLCEHLRVFPLRVEEGSNNTQVLVLAMVDPTDLAAVDQIKFHSGHQVSPLLAADQDIGNAVRRWYHGRDPLESLPPEQAPGLDPFTDLSIASRPRSRATGPIETAPAPEDLLPEPVSTAEEALEPSDLDEIDIDVDENEFSIPSQSASIAPASPAAAGEEEIDPIAEGWLIPDEDPASGQANVLPVGEESFEAPADGDWSMPVEMQPAAAAAWNVPPDFGGSTADWEAPADAAPVSLANSWEAPLASHSAPEAEWDAPVEEAEESGEPITIAPPSAAQWAVAVSQDVEQSWDAPPPATALAETELPTVRIALSAKGSAWAEPPRPFSAPLATNDSEEEELLVEEPVSVAAAWATAIPEPAFPEEPFPEAPLVEEPISIAAAWATATPERAFSEELPSAAAWTAPEPEPELELEEPRTVVASIAEPPAEEWAAPSAAITDQPSYSFSGPATDWALGLAAEESSLTVSESESQRWAIDTNQTASPVIEATPAEPTVHVEVTHQHEAEPELAAPEIVEAAPEAVESAAEVDAMMALDSSDLIGGFDDPIEAVPASEPEHLVSEAAPEIAPVAEEPGPLAEPIDVDLGEFTRAVETAPVEAAHLDEHAASPAIPEVEPEELTHSTETVAHVDEHAAAPAITAVEPEELTHSTETVAHVDEHAASPAIPEVEPEELTHSTETAAHLDEHAAPAIPEVEPEELTHSTETAAHLDEHAAPAIPEVEPEELTHSTETAAHLDERAAPAIPEVEPEELTHSTETTPIEVARLHSTETAPVEVAPVGEPEAEPIEVAPPAETTPAEVTPAPPPPGFTPAPLSSRFTEPLEITPPAHITFPPGQGLVIESPVIQTPLASRQGWTLLGIENPTPSDAVDVMGALVNLLVGRGTVSPGELTEAIRKLREPSE